MRDLCISKGSNLHTFWLVKIQDFWEPLNREIERPSVAPHRLTNDFHLKLKHKKSSSHGIHAWYGINGIYKYIYTYIWLNFMVNVGNKCMQMYKGKYTTHGSYEPVIQAWLDIFIEIGAKHPNFFGKSLVDGSCFDYKNMHSGFILQTPVVFFEGHELRIGSTSPTPQLG